ncbi:transglutaminase domain-containing protein [Cellulomonas sp. S1-8]|uniref:transglutaminase domain-containing protein n=1 Tax=Cellulomonas sp. S1-8 TaxID=2904790 RepID=UPI0022445060|nr:transglutaminase domain-containing protein [Cellulomonas sp. S1-8]UZN03403.1 transglutaminase-like domain-containing protein [Cellulomonas sp. S1-8]
MTTPDDTERSGRRDDLRDALAVTVPVPSGHQAWVTRDAALRTLRCTAADLDSLLAAGLAHQGGQVERNDVWNVGLHDASRRSVPAREMLFFDMMLRSEGADWLSARRYTAVAEARCPRGPACAEPVWPQPPRSGARWESQTGGPGASRWTGDVVLSGRRTTPDPVLGEVWDHLLETYAYQATPSSLARDVERTRERRVGDCEALARLLVDDLQAAGHEARLQTGYLLGGVRTRWHYWVRVTGRDGTTTSLDPSMAVLAQRFFSPEYARWCYGSELNRVVPLVEEDDFWVEHVCATGSARVPVELTLRIRR